MDKSPCEPTSFVETSDTFDETADKSFDEPFHPIGLGFAYLNEYQHLCSRIEEPCVSTTDAVRLRLETELSDVMYVMSGRERNTVSVCIGDWCVKMTVGPDYPYSPPCIYIRRLDTDDSFTWIRGEFYLDTFTAAYTLWDYAASCTSQILGQSKLYVEKADVLFEAAIQTLDYDEAKEMFEASDFYEEMVRTVCPEALEAVWRA